MDRGHDMSYQAELVTVGKYSPKAETEELLTEMDEFDDDLADELEAQQDEEVPSFVSKSRRSSLKPLACRMASSTSCFR